MDAGAAGNELVAEDCYQIKQLVSAAVFEAQRPESRSCAGIDLSLHIGSWHSSRGT